MREEFLEWNNRLGQIKREIIWADPDILCLQEIEEQSELHEFLFSQGYTGIFCKKPEDSRKDGSSIYFKESRFELLSHYEVPYCYKKVDQMKVL